MLELFPNKKKFKDMDIFSLFSDDVPEKNNVATEDQKNGGMETSLEKENW